MGEFRRVWDLACRVADLPWPPGARSAPQRSQEHGAPRRVASVAMKLTGHKTESVYRRYAIVSDADLRAATAALSAPVAHSASHSGEIIEMVRAKSARTQRPA